MLTNFTKATLGANREIRDALMSFNDIGKHNDRERKDEGDLETRLQKLEKTEKREKARLFNIVAGGEELHEELGNGRKNYEVLADIPKYFKLKLFPERKPPGKIIITFI